MMTTKRMVAAALAAFWVAAGYGAVEAGGKAPRKVVDLANSSLVGFGTDPEIVKAVKAENARGKTLDAIKKLDEEWHATPGTADYMLAMMDSECGRRLHFILNSKPYFSEIFAMDNQGACVCMTHKSNHYWHGYAHYGGALFKEAFKRGMGDVHVSDVKFDYSKATYLVQASVPVKDGERVVGVITFVIDVEKVP